MQEDRDISHVQENKCMTPLLKRVKLPSGKCIFYPYLTYLPPETEARNRKLTVFAMSLCVFFCVLWAYFVVTRGMSTNRGLQQAKFEE